MFIGNWLYFFVFGLSRHFRQMPGGQKSWCEYQLLGTLPSSCLLSCQGATGNLCYKQRSQRNQNWMFSSLMVRAQSSFLLFYSKGRIIDVKRFVNHCCWSFWPSLNTTWINRKEQERKGKQKVCYVFSEIYKQTLIHNKIIALFPFSSNAILI